MRYVLLILVLISFSASAQLQGVYSRDGEVYSFHPEGTFDWIHVSSETTYGNGNFVVKGKQLELTFRKARLQHEVQVYEVKPSPNDKTIVEVRIMYSNGQPATGAAISFIQSTIRQFVNALGILKLELSDPPVTDKIIIEADGRQSFQAEIKLKGYNTLMAIVIDETNKYKENVTETLSFKMKRGKILLNRQSFKKAGLPKV
jgi:hypothetical protein